MEQMKNAKISKLTNSENWILPFARLKYLDHSLDLRLKFRWELHYWQVWWKSVVYQHFEVKVSLFENFEMENSWCYDKDMNRQIKINKNCETKQRRTWLSRFSCILIPKGKMVKMICLFRSSLIQGDQCFPNQYFQKFYFNMCNKYI